MALPYTVREGFSGLKRARFATIASISAITVALVLIFVFGLIGFYGQQVSNYLRQWVGEVEVFLEEVNENMALSLRDRAEAVSGVAEARYISQEEAETIFMAEFGEGAEAYIGEQFLPASIRVRVEPAYANPDSLEIMVVEFSSWTRVEDVVYNQPLLAKVQQNLRLFTILGGALGLLVIFAALLMVANTIRLTIYARRLLIRTMKLVGATDRFIRRPFLVEGMIQGFIAGVAAALCLWAAMILGSYHIPQLAEEGWPGGSPFIVLAAAVVAGLIMGWIGSWLAVRRFIHRVELH